MGDTPGPEKKKAEAKPPALAASPKPSVQEETASVPERRAKLERKERPRFRVVDGGKKD